jgi:sugar-specific transcriptional regulator TrmB
MTVLVNGTMTAGEVARNLGIHRLDAYNALKSLGARGMIESSLTKLMIFKSVSPVMLAEILRKSNEEEQNKKLDALHVLQDIDGKLKIKSRAQHEKRNIPRIKIFSGVRPIHMKTAEMTNQTTREFLEMVTERSVNSKPSLSEFIGKSLSLRSRGIEVKLLCPITESVAELGDKLPLDIRVMTGRVSTRMIIVDKKEAILSFQREDLISLTHNEDTAIWTDSRHIIETLRTLFLFAWDNGPMLQRQLAK